VEAGSGGRGPTAAAAAVVDPTRGTKSSEAIDIILKYVRTAGSSEQRVRDHSAFVVVARQHGDGTRTNC